MRRNIATIIKALLATTPAVAVAATTCNGHPELCTRRYTDVTFFGAHGSPFVGTSVSSNQNIPIPDQLAMGVRFLQAQTHTKNNGKIQLCHTDCNLEDAGTLREALLAPVKTFLDENPAEVVTLLLTNPDGFRDKDFAKVFRQSGLRKYAFAGVQTNVSLHEWPTLGEMIESGKRLVVFVDYPKDPSVPYILDEFGSFMVETPFEYDDLTDLSTCPIDRPAGGWTKNRMLLMNHWLQKNISGILLPDRCQATTTNSEMWLKRHAQNCKRMPHFVLLDWIDIGDPMRVQDMFNELKPKHDAIEPGRPVEGCDDDPDDPDWPEDPGEIKRRGDL